MTDQKEKIRLYRKKYYLKNKDKLIKSAKECRQNYPWRKHFYNARKRCNFQNNYVKKGIRFLMTKDDFKYLWERDKAWLLKNPSIDRIDNNGNYICNNCQFIELKENLKLGSKLGGIVLSKEIWQLDKKHNLINKWESVSLASKELGLSRSGICNCALGWSKECGGYIWEYPQKGK